MSRSAADPVGLLFGMGDHPDGLCEMRRVEAVRGVRTACRSVWYRYGAAEQRGTVEPQRDHGGRDRAELLGLHEQYITEIRACLDFAHRSLVFYVGLLSALLVALLAGLLQADTGDTRILALLVGPILIVCLAELGYSTVQVFYHRFMDASLTLLNIERVLEHDKQDWSNAGISPVPVPSRYGGLIARWTGLQDWLETNPGRTLEDAKDRILEDRMRTPLDIFKKMPHLTKTLSHARMTMWVFEVAGLLLIPVISSPAAASPRLSGEGSVTGC